MLRFKNKKDKMVNIVFCIKMSLSYKFKLIIALKKEIYYAAKLCTKKRFATGKSVSVNGLETALFIA